MLEAERAQFRPAPQSRMRSIEEARATERDGALKDDVWSPAAGVEALRQESVQIAVWGELPLLK
jgi:hypothetical protein